MNHFLSKKFKISTLFVAALAVSYGLYSFYQLIQGTAQFKADEGYNHMSTVNMPGQLSLSGPTQQTVGSTFDVGSIVNTGGTAITGYTINVLYDPNLLEPINSPPVTITNKIATTPPENVLKEAGKIYFSQQIFPPGYNGNDTAGIIKFKAKNSGTANLTYYIKNFAPDSYYDSDLIGNGGDDILGNVTNLAITITKSSDTNVSPTPIINPATPTPTPSPTSNQTSSTNKKPTGASSNSRTSSTPAANQPTPSSTPAAAVSPTLTTIKSSKRSVIANGLDSSTISIVVRDINGTVITDKKPKITVSGSENNLSAIKLDDKSWQSRLTSTKAEEKIITVSVEGTNIDAKANITFEQASSFAHWIGQTITLAGGWLIPTIYTLGFSIILLCLFSIYRILKTAEIN